MCGCTHTQAVRKWRASCCPAVHLIAVHFTLTLFMPCLVNPLKIRACATNNSKNNGLSAEDGSVWSLWTLCVYVWLHVSVCVFSELEQAALGGVFCCSWGATVLSPNRSLVPAVVPREGFWMRGSNFTHTPPPLHPQLEPGLPHHPLYPLGLAKRQKGVRLGWDGMFEGVLCGPCLIRRVVNVSRWLICRGAWGYPKVTFIQHEGSQTHTHHKMAHLHFPLRKENIDIYANETPI